MLRLNFNFPTNRPPRVLVVGAHSDDIEIGCGGTMLRLIAEQPALDIRWVVLCSTPARAEEARQSAAAFLGASQHTVEIATFQDGFLPYQGREVKERFETFKTFQPDLIFTHCRHDLHQDHRLTCELTWSTFRDHLILEYEIPKYDGDLGVPNFFIPLGEAHAVHKVDLLMEHFATQRGKHWFQRETFLGLMRLRGVECQIPGYAEAFYCRKVTI